MLQHETSATERLCTGAIINLLIEHKSTVVDFNHTDKSISYFEPTGVFAK